MKLISLKTTNFKKLGTSSFSFTDGLNIIAGENARGKSTLLQAIEAALFGVTTIPGKKENIPTWGQSTFAIELSFNAEAGVFTLSRTKTTAKLLLDGELVANGNSPVSAYIEDMLGLNAKDYSLFMQSRQGETTGLLTFGGTALARKIEEFAGAGTIDEVRSLANSRATEANANANVLDVDPEFVAELESDLAEDSEKLAALEEEYAKHKDTLQNLKPPAFEEVSVSSQELSRIRREADAKAVERVELEGRLRAAEEAVSEASDNLPPSPGVAPEFSEEQKAALADAEAIRDAAMKHIEQCERNAKTLKQLGEKLAALEVPEDQSEELDVLEKRAVEETAVLQELKSQRARIKSMADDATCPTCGSSLTDHDPEQLAKELAELKQSVEDADLSLLETNNKLAKVRKAEKVRVRVEAEAKSLEAQIGEIADDVAEPADYEDYAKKVADAQKLLAGWDEYLQAKADHRAELKSYDEAVDRLDTTKGRVEKLLHKLSSIEVPENVPTDEEIQAVQELERLNTERVEAFTKEELRLKQLISESKRDSERFSMRVEALKEKLEKLRSDEEKQKQFLKTADQAKRLSKFLAERRTAYMQDVWDSILGAASRQVAQSTGGTISRIDYKDGEFLFFEEGIEAPVTSASGAQRAHIGVAIRIAMARVLYGTDALLIFDEPTESMSETNAAALAGTLCSAAKQVLLITHREQDQVLANNVISL